MNWELLVEFGDVISPIMVLILIVILGCMWNINKKLNELCGEVSIIKKVLFNGYNRDNKK